MAAGEVKLVIVPADAEVPGAVAEAKLPPGTHELYVEARWTITEGTSFRGGAVAQRVLLRK